MGVDGALRLTTARYFTPAGRSIQAKGITPDIEVLQDAPDDIKAKTDTGAEGKASLRGHLKGDDGKEQTGSQSYIPPDKKDDKALALAADLLRGIKVDPAFPPSVKNASIQNRTFLAVGADIVRGAMTRQSDEWASTSASPIQEKTGPPASRRLATRNQNSVTII